MPESQRHKRMCELMYQILEHALAPEHAIVSDCFVYFDAGNDQRCVAPDDFVKIGYPHHPHSKDAWQVWQKGAPELAIEILSPSDTKETLAWETKMERYRALGVRELIAFDADEAPGARMRAWDRIDGDLVERVVQHETTPCLIVSALLSTNVDCVLAPGVDVSLGLRLSGAGTLLPTALEAQMMATDVERAAKEAERAAKEAERAAKERALDEIGALRAELERMKKGGS